jgi:hypothetical protein
VCNIVYPPKLRFCLLDLFPFWGFGRRGTLAEHVPIGVWDRLFTF